MNPLYTKKMLSFFPLSEKLLKIPQNLIFFGYLKDYRRHLKDEEDLKNDKR